MSYTVPSSAEPQRVRPATVTVSSWLLYLVAALQVISVAVLISNVGVMRDVYEDLYANTADERLRDSAVLGVTIGVVIASIFALIFAAGFVTLGMLNNRGKNASRIVTWVLAGIGVCCFGLGTVSNAASSTFSDLAGGTGGEGAPDPADVQSAVADALPSWYDAFNIGVSAVSLIAALLVIILLALPASNAFFRRPEPTLEPPAYPQTS